MILEIELTELNSVEFSVIVILMPPPPPPSFDDDVQNALWSEAIYYTVLWWCTTVNEWDKETHKTLNGHKIKWTKKKNCWIITSQFTHTHLHKATDIGQANNVIAVASSLSLPRPLPFSYISSLSIIITIIITWNEVGSNESNARMQSERKSRDTEN